MRGNLISWLLPLGLSATASAASAMPIRGAVQFWSRTCRVAGQCDLPSALGSRQPVTGEVAPPGAPGQIGQSTFSFAEGDLTLDLKILWPAPPNGSTPYLVAQALLTRGGSAPVMECSQFHSQDVAKFFPVGACAGFVADPEGGYLELGVTFYKE